MKYRIAINKMATGKLPQGDLRWDAFNNSFVNRELEPVEIANEIYTGHAYTTWMTGKRKLEHFICAQHIAVDMDTGDVRSSFDALMQHDLVRMYASLMHTTPSHTIECPRARVIFLLDTPITDAQGYQRAAKFLIAQFGADPACSDASRFFYGCKDCDMRLLDNVLPLAHLRTFYRKYGKAMMATAPNQKAASPSSVVQPAKSSQAPTDDLGKVAQALSQINPWSMDYNKWIAILAALHDEFGDAALPLAERWAQGQDGEVERKWKSFGRYAGQPATIASIFDLVKTH